MGKKKYAPQPQSINISEILSERLQDVAVEISPCRIFIPKKIDEEKHYVVSVSGDDLDNKLDLLLARAKEGIRTEGAELYLHACRKIKNEGNPPALKGVNLYYRLKKPENIRR